MAEAVWRDKRGKYVQAMLICGVCASLAGCTGLRAWRSQSAAAPSQPAAAPDSVTQRRLLGQAADDRPLLPEPGNIWADVQPGKSPTAPQPGPVPGNPPASSAGTRKPEVAASEPRTPSAAGVQVQLAAATSRTAAEAVWRRLGRRQAGLVRELTPEITPASVAGRQVWRLRVGGFASSADAARFCAALTKDREPCWVAGTAGHGDD